MERDSEHAGTGYIAGAADQPLIGVLVEEGGRRIVRYSIDGPAIASDAASAVRLQSALSVIGAWSDLDWVELSSDLDRIRHETPPTPPIEV